MNRYKITDSDGVVTIDAPTISVAVALYVRDINGEDQIRSIERVWDSRRFTWEDGDVEVHS
jgi:hypothetical protein